LLWLLGFITVFFLSGCPGFIPNQLPVAVINAKPTSGNAPLTVNFDGSASSDPDGSIISYEWNFGDGNTGSGATVSHTYTTTGTFSVTLTVTDNDGAADTVNKEITVNPTVLFFDDFEDGNADGWIVDKPPGTSDLGLIEVKVEDDSGNFLFSFQGGVPPPGGGGGNRIGVIGSGNSWTDYTVNARVKVVQVINPGSVHGIMGRVQDSGRYYECTVQGETSGGNPTRAKIFRLDGSVFAATDLTPSIVLSDFGSGIVAGEWFTMKLEFKGTQIRCYINNQLILEATDATYVSGGIGLENAGGHTHFDDVLVTQP